MWPNSNILPSSCVAVAEIVNLPNQFVSKSPYLVVAQTHWIVWYDLGLSTWTCAHCSAYSVT
jgi:ubiquitin-conjugating enzyme E2 Q